MVENGGSLSLAHNEMQPPDVVAELDDDGKPMRTGTILPLSFVAIDESESLIIQSNFTVQNSKFT